MTFLSLSHSSPPSTYHMICWFSTRDIRVCSSSTDFIPPLPIYRNGLAAHSSITRTGGNRPEQWFSIARALGMFVFSNYIYDLLLINIYRSTMHTISTNGSTTTAMTTLDSRRSPRHHHQRTRGVAMNGYQDRKQRCETPPPRTRGLETHEVSPLPLARKRDVG